MFPPHLVLTLRAAQQRFQSGGMVTVTRTASGAVDTWAYACIRRETFKRADGTVATRTVERAPTRRLRFQSLDMASEATRLALALLDDTSGPGYVGDAKARDTAPSGIVLLLPTRCTAPKGDDGSECGDVLTAPESIKHGTGPICGGRRAAEMERSAAKRAKVGAAWAGLLPGNAWNKLASQATDQMARDRAADNRTARATCNGTCAPGVWCVSCDGPPPPAA